MNMWATSSLLISCLFIGLILVDVTSSQGNNVIEARVFVDRAAFDKWKNVTGKSSANEIRHEVNGMFVEVAEHLASMPHLNFKLKIKGAVELSPNFLPLKSNGQVSFHKATNDFRSWLIRQNKDIGDLSILLTGLDMYDFVNDREVTGVGRLGSVCTSAAVGIVETNWKVSESVIISHEIGHILGIEHDGLPRGTADCPKDSGHILNPSPGLRSPNRFFFSTCSARMAKIKMDNLTRERQNCLTDSDDGSYISGPKLGSIISADEVCKRYIGRDSFVARIRYSPTAAAYGDNVCTYISCVTDPVLFRDTPAYSYDGLNCGNGKQCRQGKCVTTAGAPTTISDSCPFGDQPILSGQGVTVRHCTEVSTRYCQVWQNECCIYCTNLLASG